MLEDDRFRARPAECGLACGGEAQVIELLNAATAMFVVVALLGALFHGAPGVEAYRCTRLITVSFDRRLSGQQKSRCTCDQEDELHLVADRTDCSARQLRMRQVESVHDIAPSLSQFPDATPEAASHSLVAPKPFSVQFLRC